MEQARQPGFEFAGFKLDRRTWSLLDPEGRPVKLTPKAFDALIYFAEHPGDVIDRGTLLEALWPNAVVEENSVSQLVAALRRALGDAFIETVPRRGYRFVPAVTPIAASAESRPGAAQSAPGAARAGGEAARAGRSRRYAAPAGLAATVLIVLAAALLFVLDAPDERHGALAALKKVAVLPCEDIGPDPGQAYVAAGLHEEVLSRLRQRGVVVVARTSVMQYAEDRPPIAEIARELAAASVMECSVRRAGSSFVVTVQLLDPATEADLWSHSYSGDLGDLDGLFALQADIAVDIARAVDAELSPRAPAEDPKLPTESPEAYAQYLRALDADPAFEAPETMIPLLDKAIELDADFAEAHAMRAMARLAQSRAAILATTPDFRPDEGAAPPVNLLEIAARAWADADRALALDPTLGLAELVAATRYGFPVLDEARFHAGLERALELSPNDSTVLYMVAGFYLAELRRDEAHALLERLGEVDPNFSDLGRLLWLAGDLDAAWAHAKQFLEWHPTDVYARSGMVMLETQRGHTAEASFHLGVLDDLRHADGADFPAGYADVYRYGRLGLPEKARQAFEEIVRDEHAGHAQYPANWIYHYLGIGDVDAALEAAKRVAEQPLPPWIEIDHYFVLNATGDAVLERPAFLKLRREMGFR